MKTFASRQLRLKARRRSVVIERRLADPTVQQRGVALVMALVILFILTLLGIASMSTSTLQEKMAGNIQEATRAFQAAESGINSALRDTNILNPNGSVTNIYNYSGHSGSATVVSTFTQNTPPSRNKQTGKIYSAINFNAANFDLKSTGTTPTNATSTHYQGIEQIAAKLQ